MNETRWFCVRCGREMEIGDRYCPKDGNTVYRPVYGEKTEESSERQETSGREGEA